MECKNNITISFTGMRPGKLFGYDLKHPKYKLLIELLEKRLEPIILSYNHVHFIAGGALGFDTIAAITVLRLKKKYTNISLEIAIPFEEQYILWREKDIRLYMQILEEADIKTFVDTLQSYKQEGFPVGKFSNIKMQSRNMYMIDKADSIIALYNGQPGGTHNAVNYAEKLNKSIDIIDPKDIK